MLQLAICDLIENSLFSRNCLPGANFLLSILLLLFIYLYTFFILMFHIYAFQYIVKR